jgi:hypothetical protein
VEGGRGERRENAGDRKQVTAHEEKRNKGTEHKKSMTTK